MCLRELQVASMLLEREGFVSRPSWEELKTGARPPPPLNADLGEWQHGWQYHASSASEHHFRETVVLARSCAGDQAHLRSHSGPGVGAVFHRSDASAAARTTFSEDTEPPVYILAG